LFFELIRPISDIFDVILTYIYGVIPNFGISIIILTLMVKLVTFPLNNKQIQSAKKMQEVQPEIKKIQEKYKNDKEKQNRAVMEFMQKNKVNPLAGCLPLLVQMPVLIGIFHLLREGNDAGFSIYDKIGENVHLIPQFDLLGIEMGPIWNLLLAPTEDPALYIFPALAAVTTFLYQRMSMTDPSQKMLFYMMPALLFFISFSLPVGVVLYWVTNNMFSMGQHVILKDNKAGLKTGESLEQEQEKEEKKIEETKKDKEEDYESNEAEVNKEINEKSSKKSTGRRKKKGAKKKGAKKKK